MTTGSRKSATRKRKLSTGLEAQVPSLPFRSLFIASPSAETLLLH
jgi:hypothetical protein